VQRVGQHGHRVGLQRGVEQLLDDPARVLLHRRVDPVGGCARVGGEVEGAHVGVECRGDVVEVTLVRLQAGSGPEPVARLQGVRGVVGVQIAVVPEDVEGTVVLAHRRHELR
jgi:hypothetical protein